MWQTPSEFHASDRLSAGTLQYRRKRDRTGRSQLRLVADVLRIEKAPPFGDFLRDKGSVRGASNCNRSGCAPPPIRLHGST
jgi:hypothetical protein